ncbi:MAG: hypothetical protein KGH67_01835 [Candidatus Micrarchaeota archaeon]|nr:hypothetical protein [Candidatus Micrarchaeota archaeon]MDE1859246.1 hypothetical protein [Candidatus Micrarchaeota archaeon]
MTTKLEKKEDLDDFVWVAIQNFANDIRENTEESEHTQSCMVQAFAMGCLGSFNFAYNDRKLHKRFMQKYGQKLHAMANVVSDQEIDFDKNFDKRMYR